jgi:parallel beta-helix repeat protein
MQPLESRRLLSGTVYVDAIAPGPVNDGSSWANAFTSLQTALGVVVSGQTIEVGQGTYTPGSSPTATFQLIDGVMIEGGFAGFGASNPDARNVAAYPTIRSGDIGTPGDNADNCYNVVTGNNTNSTAVLDGFTITAGNAGNSGYANSADGAMSDSGGNPTINNCAFSGNSGGGMFNYYSSPTLTNCTFSENSGGAGGSGGMSNFYSSPRLTNCTFSGNNGDGMYNYCSSPTLTNCIITGNSLPNGGSGGYGGGMFNSSSSPMLTDCTFSGNSANGYESGGYGGGRYN